MLDPVVTDVDMGIIVEIMECVLRYKEAAITVNGLDIMQINVHRHRVGLSELQLSASMVKK